MTNNHSHPVSLITQYRMPLMGLAAIWIVLYHSFSFDPGFLGSILRFVKSIGYFGVDIFFFLSGLGLMMGWYKKRYSLKAFYMRRFLRIMPAYWIVILLGLAARSVLGAPCPIGKFVANFFCVGYLTHQQTIFGLWFVGAIIIFYLVFPVLAYILTKSQKSFMPVIIVTFVSLATAIFLGWIDYGSHLIMFILRWPAFLLGMYTGLCIVTQNYTYIDKVSPRVLCFLLITGFILLFIVQLLAMFYIPRLFLWQKGIWFYPCVLMSYPFCYFAACLCNRYKDFYITKRLLATLSFFGKNSWEIYIVNVVALNITRGRLTAYRQFHPELFVVTAAIFFAIFLHYLLQSNYVLSLFKTTDTSTS
jgi:peptidoglycan/LPS O-acetylase OafA/YrhL